MYVPERDRHVAYRNARIKRMDEMLTKTRGKLSYLIKEAKELGLSHLLTDEELSSLDPRKAGS